ncbi:inositol-tetrakisphosphate 1-kinase [Clupea harengus]|uniref:Inositol-tetrakisphosphate 1-kinase n=1 Tax=Clupea harengus TaxID=7950 RepID=A0A6P3VRG6_CLUHA|nr:inositol-tetrakisphosphate 1-kinase [Clupea harengus]
MQTFLKGKRVGYWLSEKKIKKLNFLTFVDMCRKRGIEIIQLDLSRPLEEQGPLDVIIHKLTDHILEADQKDTQAQLLVQSVQDYIDAHPEVVVLDPMPAIRTLLDRAKSYQLIHKIEGLIQDDRICSPPFMVLRSECGGEILAQLQQHDITFPCICKTQVAHGTSSHEMAIIFSEEDLRNIKPPCVIQSFINHNAVLYKVFVVGEAYSVVERPSIRNFPSGPTDRRAISFNSHHVSKPESSSALTSRDNLEGQSQVPSDDVIQMICRCLRQTLGISLFGIDIIINTQTGQHAVIDINAFPGYEGVPEFFDDLLSLVTSTLQAHATVGGVPRAHPWAGGVQGQGNPAAVETLASAKPCGMQESEGGAWIVDEEGMRRSPHQGMGCSSGMSASFKKHCAPSSLATKASSQ